MGSLSGNCVTTLGLLPGCDVYAFESAAENFVSQAVMVGAGYTFASIPDGTYKFYVHPHNTLFPEQWVTDEATHAAADVVTVAGVTVLDLDIYATGEDVPVVETFYVTGADILAHVRKSSPAADDTAWAQVCADAIEALIAHRMGDVTVTDFIRDEITRAAIQDGAAAYMDREAPHGVQSFGPDGESVRLGRDLSRSLYPVFIRYAGPGIG